MHTEQETHIQNLQLNMFFYISISKMVSFW